MNKRISGAVAAFAAAVVLGLAPLAQRAFAATLYPGLGQLSDYSGTQALTPAGSVFRLGSPSEASAPFAWAVMGFIGKAFDGCDLRASIRQFEDGNYTIEDLWDGQPMYQGIQLSRIVQSAGKGMTIWDATLGSQVQSSMLLLFQNPLLEYVSFDPSKFYEVEMGCLSGSGGVGISRGGALYAAVGDEYGVFLPFLPPNLPMLPPPPPPPPPQKYVFGGFLSPVKADGSGVYQQGKTLPVKFQLSDINSGQAVADASATLTLARISDNVAGAQEVALSTSAADTENQFRYDASGSQYVYNLATKPLAPGTWQLQVRLDDERKYTVNVSIR